MGMDDPRLGEIATAALRYWEPRRLVYNALLLLTVAGCFLAAWPGSLTRLDLDLVLVFFVLAVAANVLYSLAYIADIFLQLSALRDRWLRRRWVLFAIGTATAVILARFMAAGAFTARH
jgi:hypothetical protein